MDTPWSVSCAIMRWRKMKVSTDKWSDVQILIRQQKYIWAVQLMNGSNFHSNWIWHRFYLCTEWVTFGEEKNALWCEILRKQETKTQLMFVFLSLRNPPQNGIFANIYWGTFLSSVWKFWWLVHHSFLLQSRTKNRHEYKRN